MLVLSRCRDETIVISVNGETVAQVTVIDIRSDKVRLGFTADRNVQIDRVEFLTRKESKQWVDQGKMTATTDNRTS